MNRPQHANLLYRLQEQLQHFDRSADFGDAETVAAIRQHLLVRIREAEGMLRCSTPFPVERISQAEAA